MGTVERNTGQSGQLLHQIFQHAGKGGVVGAYLLVGIVVGRLVVPGREIDDEGAVVDRPVAYGYVGVVATVTATAIGSGALSCFTPSLKPTASRPSHPTATSATAATPPMFFFILE